MDGRIMLEVNWATFKSFIQSRGLSIQYFSIENYYFLYAVDGTFSIQCKVLQDGSADVVDFESNFKAAGNKKITLANQPFDAKELPNGKKLYYRLHGIVHGLTSSPETIEFVIPYLACKITGIEIINGDIGDKASLKVCDTSTGIISGVPNYALNQFAFDMNIGDKLHRFTSPYDADLIQGMKIRIDYASPSTLPKTIYINFHLHEVK